MGQRFLPPEEQVSAEAEGQDVEREGELVINERILKALREKLIFDAASSKYGHLDDFNLNTLRGLTLNQALVKYPKLLQIMDDVLVKVSSAIAGTLSAASQQRESVEQSYEFAQHLKKFGKWFHRNGHYDQAIKAFEGALEFLAGDQEIYTLLGDIYVTMERYREAVVCYKEAFVSAPEDKSLVRKLAGTHVKMGEMFLRSSCLDEAVAVFQEALCYLENYMPALCGLGEVLFIQGEHDEARVYFEQALDTDPSSVRALNGLANVHVVSGDDDEAEYIFNEALLSNPVYIPALYDFASFCFHQRGNFGRAINYAERALHLNPNDVTVLLLKAQIAMEMNAFDTAEETVERILKLQPNNKEAFEYFCRLKNGDCFLPKKYMSTFRSVSDDRQARSRDYYFSLRYQADPHDETAFESYLVDVAKDSGDRLGKLKSPYDGWVFLN